ncbi:MAG: DNA recombination protein RmuC [candidate division NC10 bacterium]|nr:DNA recombination protein RmuC [candidate division NC10 bacterium]
MTQSQLLVVLGVLGFLLVLGFGFLALYVRRRPGEEAAGAVLANLQASLGDLGSRVGQLSGEVQGVARTQETVRSEIVQTREQGNATVQQTAEALTERIHQTQQALTSVTELVNRTVRTQELLAQHLGQVQESLAGNLTAAQQGLRTEITQTRELVAQIQAADQIREKREQEGWDALKRLETVLAGTKSRGIAGENILGTILAQLPAELRETNLTINNKPVEFALRLPHGRLLPIDSKWPALAPLERLQETEDPAARRALVEEIQTEVKKKVREVTKYLDPDRTIHLGVLAVPDAVFEVCVEAHVEAFKQGIVIISYTQAIPYLLSLLQVVWRFGSEIDTARLSQALTTIADALEKMDGEVDGRLSRTITQLQNSREELKGQLSRARQGARGLHAEAGPAELPAAPDTPRLL